MKLAIDGGPPVFTGTWPRWPIWDATEEQALLDVLHSGQWWAVGGTRVPAFEEAFAQLHEANFGCAVTNGSAALEIGLRALGIGPGDEVIVPPYTFIATASSVLAVGATPIFVDIEPGSLNLDPALIPSALTPRTRAIIAVHIAGCPADLDGILAVARAHGLAVIEDAAQAHLAEWRGKKVGALGDLGTFSFQASKNLNCGEGGVIVANDETLADKIWSVHNVGRPRDGRWYEHHVLGGNFRMTEWQAAILLAQLGRLETQAQTRTANADYLTALLAGQQGIGATPPDLRVTRHARHLFVLRYDSTAFGGRSRDVFLEALEAEGVPCTDGYVPLYKESLFLHPPRGIDYDYSAVSCPVCEAACEQSVWLHQHLLLAGRTEMEAIAEAIAKIQRAWG